jgi:hypothetical protein
MKRITMMGMGCLLAVAVSWTLILCSALYHSHGSLSIRCGLLATASDSYLDDSRKVFQKCSWHIGNATRTWGETYGLRLRRLYLSLEVSHTNPLFTPDATSENE